MISTAPAVPGIKTRRREFSSTAFSACAKSATTSFPSRSSGRTNMKRLRSYSSASIQPARAAELVLAQLALRLPGAIVDKFDEAMDEYAELGYDLDARFLTRALIAIGTGQSRFRSLTHFWKQSPNELDQ